MLDTSRWPEVNLDVLKDVHLDPKNVRLEDADAKVEADIMEDLFANENALSLVDGICKIGYLTHETPVVIQRKGKYIVVEGNRRLAALKAIQNPLLVPDFSARVAALSGLLSDRSALSRVRVMIAPDQAEADQLIAAIHTGNLRRPWTPGRQAAFFQAQIDAGRKLDELLERYPTIDVRKFVFRAHIINLFKSVNYDDPDLKDFLSTKRWAQGLSTLARIYESKAFLDLTGLSMDKEGNIAKAVSDPTFARIATAIVRGMFEENINTRSLNSIRSPRYTQLMAELNRIVAEDRGHLSPDGEASKPDPRPENAQETEEADTEKPPTSTNSTDESNTDASGNDEHQSESSSDESSATPTSASPKSSRAKKKQRHLDLGQVKAPDSYPEAVKLLLGELSEIDVQKYPNATFLMIRAILEKSIKSFAEAKGIDIRKAGKSEGKWVQLRHAMDWLMEYVKINGPKYLIQVIENVRTGKLVPYTDTQDSLNASNHNHHFNVDPDQAISMWASVDSIMRFVMKP